MRIRITEHITKTEEVSYDLDAPAHVFYESEGESVEDHRPYWTEVGREGIRRHAVVVNIEQVDE
jgi:hypothetical protein